MITVHKYIIGPNGSEIKIPCQATILKVAFQNSDLCFWAEVDTDNELRTRKFYAFGTGHKIPHQMGVDYKYIGTGF